MSRLRPSLLINRNDAAILRHVSGLRGTATSKMQVAADRTPLSVEFAPEPDAETEPSANVGTVIPYSLTITCSVIQPLRLLQLLIQESQPLNKSLLSMGIPLCKKRRTQRQLEPPNTVTRGGAIVRRHTAVVNLPWRWQT